MRTARRNGEIARFGAFEADLRNSELRKLGFRIKLQGQPFRILASLLRSQGQLVSRAQIRETLWGDDCFVEFDRGINTAIQKIRGALNDSASNPRFIETVPRRGYRFIAPVEFASAKPSPRGHTVTRYGTSGVVAQIASLVERSLSFVRRSRSNQGG